MTSSAFTSFESAGKNVIYATYYGTPDL